MTGFSLPSYIDIPIPIFEAKAINYGSKQKAGTWTCTLNNSKDCIYIIMKLELQATYEIQLHSAFGAT